jgi:hypothetical protein
VVNIHRTSSGLTPGLTLNVGRIVIAKYESKQVSRDLISIIQFILIYIHVQFKRLSKALRVRQGNCIVVLASTENKIKFR